MESFKDSVSSWACVLGTILGAVGAIQSLTWLTAVGALMLITSLFAIAYARRQRQLVESVVLKVAGRSVDSLNMATLRRRLNRSLAVQEAHNEATIDGENLKIVWECAGFCRAERETSIEFSVDSDNNVPFDELDCFAHDLEHDPERRHRIRPILIGPDGISKKIAVPFLQPLTHGEPFKVFLSCELPGCMKAGIDYYTASISFGQENVLFYSLRLLFMHDRPKWVRAYEAGGSGTLKLVKDLRPNTISETETEYIEVERNLPPTSVRVYVFSRSRASRDRDQELPGAGIASL